MMTDILRRVWLHTRWGRRKALGRFALVLAAERLSDINFQDWCEWVSDYKPE